MGAVLVLGAYEWQRDLLLGEMARIGSPLQEITGEVQATDRTRLYASPMALLVTYRILVVDLLRQVRAAAPNESVRYTAFQRFAELRQSSVSVHKHFQARAGVRPFQALRRRGPQRPPHRCRHRGRVLVTAAATNSACHAPHSTTLRPQLCCPTRPSLLALFPPPSVLETLTPPQPRRPRSVRLCRQQGSYRGPVVGLTEDAAALASGFSKAEKVLKGLHVRRLLVWPRFRAEVKESLGARAPEVVEVQQDLTECQKAVQGAIGDIVERFLKELRRFNKIDATELTLKR